MSSASSTSATDAETLRQELRKAREELAVLKEKLAVAELKYTKYDKLVEEEGLDEKTETKYKEERAVAQKQQELLTTRERTLTTQITELEKNVASSSESKRVRLVPESETNTAPGFVNQTFIIRNDIDFENPSEVNFHTPLWGAEGNQNFVLKRASAGTLALNAVDAFMRSKPRPSVIIAGTKGIGKSCEGLFILKKLVEKTTVVLFERGTEKMLILNQEAFERYRNVLDAAFEGFGQEPLTKSGVYQFVEAKALFVHLTKNTSFVHLIDMGENPDSSSNIEISADHGQIIISSPNSAKLKRIGEIRDLRIVYLPIWEREEMLRLNEKLPIWEPETKLSHTMVQKKPEELKYLLKVFGNVPREVFRPRTLDDVDDDIDELIDSVPMETLKGVLTSASYTKLSRQVPGALVHITGSGKVGNSCRVTFATPHGARLLVKKYYKSHRTDLFALAEASKGEKRLLSSLRGEMLQQQMHEVFQSRDFALNVKTLPLRGSSTDFTIKLPELHVVEFKSNKMDDLTALKENDFCIALTDKFKSIESFLILRRELLGLTGSGLCIVGLQSTTMPKHGLKRNGLKQVQAHCCRILGVSAADLPICVIFVTVPNGITSRQKLGAIEHKWDAGVSQFYTTQVNFDEILKVFPTTAELPEDEEEDDEEDEEEETS